MELIESLYQQKILQEIINHESNEFQFVDFMKRDGRQ